MKIRRMFVWAMAGVFILLLAAAPAAYSQSGAPDTGKFKQEELDQMLAPVALYPDALLAQVLMAATYPLEVVEADRWAKSNKNLKGDALNAQVDKQTWDTSVKSLVTFPQVLSMMSDKLDWTQKLGDAFLSQQKQVMDTVQKLRAKAQAQGKLTTTAQQKVVVQDQVIQIVPASPTVMYVPVYDPMVVYGPWWYPSYPPYPVYPAGAMIATNMVSFGLGVAVGAAWSSGWGSCNWHTGNVYVNNSVNINNYHNPNHPPGPPPNHPNQPWHHDPDHRRGVAYKDNAVAQKYGQPPRGNVDGRKDYRGYDNKGGQPKPSTGPGKSAPTASSSPRGAGMDNRQPSRQPSAFEGSEHGGRETAMHSDRGRTSREGSGMSRSAPSRGGSGRSGGHRR